MQKVQLMFKDNWGHIGKNIFLVHKLYKRNKNEIQNTFNILFIIYNGVEA